MDEAFQNFNKAMAKKDNFIAENMDELEDVVNSK